MKTNSVLSLAAAFATVILAGCDDIQTSKDVVTITYEQVGSCNGYPQTTGPGGSGPHHAVSSGPKAAFATFRIVTIDNSKSTKDFDFEPDRLFINTIPRASVDQTLSLAQDLGVFATIPVTVPKGHVQGNNGIVIAVVPTTTTNGASEANNTSYALQYDPAATTQTVQLVKKNPSQTTWPQTDDCRAIRF